MEAEAVRDGSTGTWKVWYPVYTFDSRMPPYCNGLQELAGWMQIGWIRAGNLLPPPVDSRIRW